MSSIRLLVEVVVVVMFVVLCPATGGLMCADSDGKRDWHKGTGAYCIESDPIVLCFESSVVVPFVEDRH